LLNHERIALASNLILILLSFLAGTSNDLSPSFGVAGMVIGGWFMMSFWTLSFIALVRSRESQVLPRILLVVHMIFLPVQLMALCITADSIRSDNNIPLSSQIEGSSWIFVSLFMGYLMSHMSNALQEGGAPTATPLALKLSISCYLLEILLSVVMGMRLVMVTVYLGNWLHVLWLTVLTQAGFIVFMGVITAIVFCFLGRQGLLDETMVQLFGGNFIHSTTFNQLGSSPASLVLTPFVYHYMIVFIPLIITLGNALIQNSVPGQCTLSPHGIIILWSS
jgi:hypothetical protein